MTAPVVLLGGTGDVGRRVVPLLLDHTGCPILLASRQGGADADRVRQIQLDVRTPEAAELIPSGATVINLTEATPRLWPGNSSARVACSSTHPPTLTTWPRWMRLCRPPAGPARGSSAWEPRRG